MSNANDEFGDLARRAEESLKRSQQLSEIQNLLAGGSGFSPLLGQLNLSPALKKVILTLVQMQYRGSKSWKAHRIYRFKPDNSIEVKTYVEAGRGNFIQFTEAEAVAIANALKVENSATDSTGGASFRQLQILLSIGFISCLAVKV